MQRYSSCFAWGQGWRQWEVEVEDWNLGGLEAVTQSKDLPGGARSWQMAAGSCLHPWTGLHLGKLLKLLGGGARVEAMNLEAMRGTCHL